MKTCPPLGPYDAGDGPIVLPEAWGGDPFELLPEQYQLRAEEQELVARYRNNEISTGHLLVCAQLAASRSPLTISQHADRRERLAKIQDLLSSGPWLLPESFVRLCENDDYANRIKHNNLSLHITPVMVKLPGDNNDVAVQIFSEGQGGYYVSLWLHSDGTHGVLFHEHELALPQDKPPAVAPNLDRADTFLCAPTFDEWLAVYFLDCQRADANYAQLLQKVQAIQ